jgi:steroid delta-isomerase-like uncharacterized protein
MDSDDSRDARAPSASTPTVQNKVVVQAWLEAWNTHDLDAAELLLDESFIRHDANVPDVVGRRAQRQFIAAVVAAFPDLHFDAELLVAEGDIVMSRVRGRGTQRGEFMGVPPAGRFVDFETVETYRLSDCMIAEQWVLMDALGLFQQLGAIPTDARPEAAVGA